MGFTILVAFLASWLAYVIGIFYAYPLLDYIAPGESYLLFIGLTNLLLVLGIPFIALVLLITRLVFSTRVSAPWRAGLGAFWILNLLCFGIIGSIVGRDFAVRASHLDTADIRLSSSDTLQLKPKSIEDAVQWNLFEGGLLIDEERLLIDNVRLYIRKSPDSSYHIRERLFANGGHLSSAERRAAQLEYPLEIEEQKLFVPSYFIIQKGDKWRAQAVEVSVLIPEGGYVRFDEELSRYMLWSVDQ
ncbi:MAG: hypothetical protein R3350_07735, partial [Saprospiraceae bacterium]|nr:hypothetical protein [Saprospiraceae bacterium]